MRLSDVLKLFEDFEDNITSISYNDSEEDFIIEVEYVSDDLVNYTDIELYSDGDVLVNPIRSYFESDCDTTTGYISLPFINLISNIGTIWETEHDVDEDDEISDLPGCVQLAMLADHEIKPFTKEDISKETREKVDKIIEDLKELFNKYKKEEE